MINMHLNCSSVLKLDRLLRDALAGTDAYAFL